MLVVLAALAAVAGANDMHFPFDSTNSHPGLMVEYKDISQESHLLACGTGCLDNLPTINTEMVQLKPC
jgi:hypothetical protein